MPVNPEAWDRVCNNRFPDLPRDCGRNADAGIVDAEEWRDWSDQETTPDQRRIEDYLASMPLRNKRLLHVGVGNSEFAIRFSSRAAKIVGYTVVPAEVIKAKSLGIPNYHPRLQNKYGPDADEYGETFDYIVDNNPTTFCCCLQHFAAMLENYSEKLTVDGQIVTDRVGLGWTTDAPAQPRRWAFTFEDLVALAPAFGLEAYRVSAYTYVMSRSPLPRRSALARLSGRGCRILSDARLLLGRRLPPPFRRR